MAAASKKKTCEATRKDNQGQKISCGEVLVRVYENGPFVCPKREIHLLPMKTGFCHHGACEGLRAKDARGRNMKTCMFWMTCPCDCHEVYDLMFSMAQKDRVAVDNSGYVSPENPYRLLTTEDRVASSIARRDPGATIEKSPAPDAVPSSLRRTYTATATGRAARGELEAWVKAACDVWLVDAERAPCTPVYLADEIQRTQGLGRAPSVGAISAVFVRWERIGFAVIGKKPTRFLKYTEKGIQRGLEVLKLEAKRTRAR